MRPEYLWLAGLLAFAPGCWFQQPAAALEPAEPAAAELGCVHFRALRVFLPERMTGFQVRRNEGSTGRYGEVAVSQAERVFAQTDGRELAVRIIDTTFSSKLARAITEEAAENAFPGSAPEATPFHLGDTVGFVRYDASELKAEANLLVGNRYVLAVTSRGFEGTAEVRRVAEGLNLAGLAKLR